MLLLRWLIRPLEGHGEVFSVLCSYGRVYVSQIILVMVLSAVTIFRREMSCNRVFHERDNNKNDNGTEASSTRRRQTDEDRNEDQHNHHYCHEGEWDDLLEGAGKWGSGKPFMEIVDAVWSIMMQSKEKMQVVNRKADDWTDKMSDELLEGAGLSLSGEPFWSTVVSLWARIWFKSLADHQRYVTLHSSALLNNLPPDAQIHIFSFLHPKDIMNVGCCSKECNTIVNNQDNDIYKNLWKMLWFRDYAWLVESWEVGIEARKRSERQDGPFDKQLYFEFGQTYVNYLLVGRNKVDDCFLGLHGNIYEITAFIDRHPGSPETILVHSGQDATRHFEDIGHSIPARQLAVTMCSVVDLSCHNRHGYGTRRGIELESMWAIPFASRARRPSTLHKLRKQLGFDERKAKQVFMRLVPGNMMTELVVYYDAFDRRWKAWYTDDSLETQHLL
jgi:Cytochrome b5-like Heme/Steroid binding domain/F-box domain